MKNVILGLVGSLIIVYTVALTLGIYNMNIRKNELENCVSAVLENVLTEYYEGYLSMNEAMIPDANIVSKQVKDNIIQRVKNPEELVVDVIACDIKKGIISVRVNENFGLPGGIRKDISMKKTIIVDRER